MKALLSILFLLLPYSTVFAQDTIYLHSGEEIPSKVLEISSEEVRFKKYTNLDGPLYIYSIKEIRKIRYQNGSEDVFDTAAYYLPNATTDAIPSLSSQARDMYARGQRDASHYYKNYQGAQIGAGVSSAIGGPVIGLIPAVLLSTTPPKDVNLNYPDMALIQNQEYRTGYTTEAMRIKSKKTWKGYGVGTLGYIAIVLIIMTTAGS